MVIKNGGGVWYIGQYDNSRELFTCCGISIIVDMCGVEGKRRT